MNRIQCRRVPQRKYSVRDESVNSNGREMVLLPKETFLNMEQKLKMLSESKQTSLLGLGLKSTYQSSTDVNNR